MATAVDSGAGSGNVNVLLPDACANLGSCSKPASSVEVHYLGDGCAAVKPVSTCMQLSPQRTYQLGLEYVLRTPERSGFWGPASAQLILERQAEKIVSTEILAAEDGLPLRVIRRVGLFGDISIVRDSRGFEAFVRSGEVLRRFRDVGFTQVLKFSPDQTSVFISAGTADPIRKPGAYTIVDESLPGELWRTANCVGDLFQPLTCDVIVNERYGGSLRCEVFGRQLCTISVSDGRRSRQIVTPRQHLAYDAWFYPESIDQTVPCCNYVGTAFAVRRE